MGQSLVDVKVETESGIMSKDEAKEIAEERVSILIDKGYIDEEMREEKVKQLTENLLNNRE